MADEAPQERRGHRRNLGAAMTAKPWRPSMRDEIKEGMNRRGEEMRARLGLGKDRSLRIDRAGQPMSEGDWAEASDDREYVRVAEDAVGDLRISTVWMGTDDRVIGGGPEPQIFETMLRGDAGGRAWDVDDFQRRYATERDALIGHSEIVAAVRSKLAQDGEH